MPCLDAFFDSLSDLENMNGLFRGCAREDVLVWVEQYVVNFSFAISSFEFLYNFASVGTINFDNMSSFRCGCNKRSIWIDCDRSDLGVMSRNDQINRLVNN